MKNIFIAITVGLTLTACGGDDTPPKKEMTTKELVSAAANGDKDAMRELERQAAKKAKAEKKKTEAAAKDGDPLAAFQKTLHSKNSSDEKISALADTGNPNAILYRAVMSNYDKNLDPALREKYARQMIEIARTGDNYKNHNISGGAHPLSSEAAFMIAKDKFFEGELFDKDITGGLQYLKQAAENGHAKAMFDLANRYKFALNMDKNVTKAKEWMEKSAAAGNHDAKRALKSWEE